MTIQYFWANGNFLGQRIAPKYFRAADEPVQSNRAFCCLKCGDVWARITVDTPNVGWVFCSRPCRKCFVPQFSWYHHGTLADPIHWRDSAIQFGDDWPEAAIRWEFQSMLQTYERLMNVTDNTPRD